MTLSEKIEYVRKHYPELFNNIRAPFVVGFTQNKQFNIIDGPFDTKEEALRAVSELLTKCGCGNPDCDDYYLDGEIRSL